MSEPSNSPGQLLYVFPPRSDKKISSQISSQVPIGRGHYSFVPEQLYNEFTLKYDPDERIESVLVKSAWYGKQKKRARHEFILIVVEDTGIGLTNYIVLDRNNSGNPPIAGKGSSLGNVGYSQSCQGAALDAFRVSYNGEEKQLLQECQLLPCQYVEKIEFSDTEPLFLYQLVTLVYVISKTSYNYAVMGENCYWFAGLIWESLRNLRPGAQHIDYRPKIRGRFALLHHTPDKEEVDRLCAEFGEEIVQAEERLKRSKQRWLRMSMVPEFTDSESNPDGHPTPLRRISTYVGNEVVRTHDSPQTPRSTVSPMNPDRSRVGLVLGWWSQRG